MQEKDPNAQENEENAENKKGGFPKHTHKNATAGSPNVAMTRFFDGDFRRRIAT